MKITQTPNFSAKNLSFYQSIIYLLYIKQGRFRRSSRTALEDVFKKTVGLLFQCRGEAIGFDFPAVNHTPLCSVYQAVYKAYGHAVLVECAAVDVVLLGLEAGDDVLAIVKLHQNHQHQIAADEGAIVVAAILPTGCLGTDVAH